MPYPTRDEAYQIFKLLEDPPGGAISFFTHHVSPNLQFTAVGPPEAAYTGSYTSKAAFMASEFGKLPKGVKPPGMRMAIVGGRDGIIVDEATGSAAVMLDTVDVVTHSGVPYEQHYSWHVRFGEDKVITSIHSFFDHRHIEDVLGAESKLVGVDSVAA